LLIYKNSRRHTQLASLWFGFISLEMYMFAHSSNSLLGVPYLRCLGESDRNLTALVWASSLLTDWNTTKVVEGGVIARKVARGKQASNREASLSKKHGSVFLLRCIIFILINTVSDTLNHTSYAVYFTKMTEDTSVVFCLRRCHRLLIGSITVAARFEAWVCGRSLAGIAGSNSAGDMNVRLLWVLFVVRGHCYGLITRPEKSYRVWRVWV